MPAPDRGGSPESFHGRVHRGGHVPGDEPSGRPRGYPEIAEAYKRYAWGGGRARLEVRRADRRGRLGHQDQPRKAHERRVRRLRGQRCVWPVWPKEQNLDAVHDTVHDGQDEARHGKGFEGLYKRYFGK